jgi:hypothetical protein
MSDGDGADDVVLDSAAVALGTVSFASALLGALVEQGLISAARVRDLCDAVAAELAASSTDDRHRAAGARLVVGAFRRTAAALAGDQPPPAWFPEPAARPTTNREDDLDY